MTKKIQNGIVTKTLLGIVSAGIVFWFGWLSSGVADANAREKDLCALRDRVTKIEDALKSIPEIQRDIAVMAEILNRIEFSVIYHGTTLLGFCVIRMY
jgi:hypothetical protein